jgi:drug/metabolite transporter (DMT)-like permease
VVITSLAILLLSMQDEIASMDHHHALAQAGPAGSAASLPVPALQTPEIGVKQIPALAAVLGSALCSAGNSVLSDFLLAKDKNKGLLAVSEASFFNSIIPFHVMLVMMWVTGEVHQYPNEWHRLEGIGPHMPLFVCLLGCGLALAKMFDRLSKFTIISSSGAFFFAILDTFRRMGTGLLSVWMFGEELTAAKVIALLMTSVAIGLNSKGDQRLKQIKAEKESAAELLGSHEGGDTDEESNGASGASTNSLWDQANGELELELASARRNQKGTMDRFYYWLASF